MEHHVMQILGANELQFFLSLLVCPLSTYWL